MKNIGVYLRYSPNQGGVYQFWVSIVDALVREKEQHNFEVILFAENDEWRHLADKYDLRFEILLQDKNVCKIINLFLGKLLPFSIYRKLCKVWSQYYRTILRYEIDFWFAPSPKTINKDLHIQSISPIFDLMHLYEPRFKEVQVNKGNRDRDNRQICKFASMILSDSNVGRKQIVESYGRNTKGLEKKVKVLPFIPANYIYEADKINRPIDVGFDKYIFYPAQFWSHKNHKNLLLALSLLKKKAIIVNLVCVGSEKNSLEDIEKLIEGEHLYGQVRILGYVTNDEIVSLYQHARALVMPTFFGPTNIPQLEAFVLGCPVATSNIYGIPEQVGDAALLFNPESIEEIAECIEKLWTDDLLCKELIKKGKERSALWGRTQYAETLARYIDELGREEYGSIS